MRKKLRAFLARQKAKMADPDRRAFVWTALGTVRRCVVLFRRPKKT